MHFFAHRQHLRYVFCLCIWPTCCMTMWCVRMIFFIGYTVKINIAVTYISNVTTNTDPRISYFSVFRYSFSVGQWPFVSGFPISIFFNVAYRISTNFRLSWNFRLWPCTLYNAHSHPRAPIFYFPKRQTFCVFDFILNRCVFIYLKIIYEFAALLSFSFQIQQFFCYFFGSFLSSYVGTSILPIFTDQ